jgi:hypothetical protein
MYRTKEAAVAAKMHGLDAYQDVVGQKRRIEGEIDLEFKYSKLETANCVVKTDGCSLDERWARGYARIRQDVSASIGIYSRTEIIVLVTST